MTASHYAPDTLSNGDTWRQHAACKEDPDLFFPGGNTGPWLDVIEDAKATCRHCPVLDTCRDWIMRHEGGAGLPYRHGIWAAMTERERYNAHHRAVRRPWTGKAAS